MKASDVSPDARFFGCFIGRSSSGKSAASFSFPPGVFQADADLRKGFLGCPWLKPKLKDVELWPLYPRKTTLKNIEDKFSSLEPLYNNRQRPYETIIISSIGSILRIFLNETRRLTGGREIGGLRLTGPSDYNWSYQAMYEFFDFLKSLPCNVIIEAHIQDKWGKDDVRDKDGKLLEYQETIVTGEKLAGVPENLGESLLGYFDEVYRFSKNDEGNKFYVEFQSNLARSVYPFKAGKIDITGKSFYDYWQEGVKKFTATAEVK